MQQGRVRRHPRSVHPMVSHQHASKPDSQNSFRSVQPCALIPEASYHTKLSFIPVHKMISNQMFFQYLVKKVRQDRETPGQFLLVSHWLGNILSQHCQRSTTILEQVLFLLCFSIIQPFSSFLILHNNSQASLPGSECWDSCFSLLFFHSFLPGFCPGCKRACCIYMQLCNYAVIQLCMVGQVLLQVLQRVCTLCTNFFSPKLFTRFQNISCKLNNNKY